MSFSWRRVAIGLCVLLAGMTLFYVGRTGGAGAAFGGVVVVACAVGLVALLAWPAMARRASVDPRQATGGRSRPRARSLNFPEEK